MISLALTSFFIGLLVVSIAAQLLVNLATNIADKFRVSPLIVSLVIVALGTTLPELTVTIASLAHNDPGHALGNLVGSSIANITLILGAVALIGTVKIGTVKTQKNAVILISVTGLFTLLHLLQVPSLIRGFILLAAAVTVVFYQIDMGVRGRNGEDHSLLSKIKKITRKKTPQNSTTLVSTLLVLCIIALALGGMLTVTSVEQLSRELHLSTTLLGLTLTAVSTSAPEFITTLLASLKRENKVVIGTLLGSNIFNLTLFPAIIYFVKDGVPLQYIDLVFLNAFTFFVGIVIFSFRGTYFSKQAASILLGLFLLFTAITFTVRL